MSQRQKYLQVRSVLRGNLKQGSMKVPMSTKVKERYVFRFIYSIVPMSPWGEFLRISPSAASFLFSPMDFQYVSSERILVDFTLSGLFSFSPVDLFCVSLRGNHGPCLQWFYIFISLEDLHRVSLRENHGFCLQLLYTLHFPRGFTLCLFEREPWIFPLVTLSFSSPADTVSP
jgi:hypothetical protein